MGIREWEDMKMPQKRKLDPEKFCEYCGAKMERKVYNGVLEDMGAFMRRKYCSLTCANSKKHPKHWTTFHLRAAKFKKGFCESCGCKTSLQAHHIDQNPENNTSENIQTLCKHCHDFWHTTAKRLGRDIAGRMPSLY